MVSKGSILAVDDTSASLSLLADVLSREGYEVLPADSGELALMAVEARPPDLILLDIRMEGMDGFEVCRRLKSNEKTRNIPVIMMSAIIEVGEWTKGLKLGAADYIQKPFRQEELLARVQVHLDLGRSRSELERIIVDLRKAHDQLKLDFIERQQIQDSLLAAYQELKKTKDQLVQSEKMAAIGQLAAGVAHEINNPLGYVSGNLDAMDVYVTGYLRILRLVEKLKFSVDKRDIDEAGRIVATLKALEEELDLEQIVRDSEKLLKESREGVLRIKKIVLDLKVFSREESQWQEDLVTVESAVDMALTIAANELKYRIELRKEFGSTPPIFCNVQKLGQVFLNLLVNAAQAISDKGTVTIRTYVKAGYVCVDIGDTGCGIPSAELEKVFDPFFTTKPVGKGTGLGLSVSHEIVKKHHGDLRVVSEVGRGTTFTVELPIPVDAAPV